MQSFVNQPFRDQSFLVSQGLTPENAIDYFAESPFYWKFGGPDSLNEKLRRGEISSIESAVKDDPVSYFEVVHANNEARQGFVDEGILVIQRITRAGNQKTPREVFYILAGTVHMATTLGSAIGGTLGRVSRSLREIWDAWEEVHAKASLKSNSESSTNGWPPFVKFPVIPQVDEQQVAFAIRSALEERR